jgi:hypothetical protein
MNFYLVSQLTYLNIALDRGDLDGSASLTGDGSGDVDVSPARCGELPGVQVANLAEQNLEVGLVVTFDCHLSQVAVGQKLHARLEELHGRNLQALLALVQTSEHFRLLILVQEHRQTSQVAPANS